MEEEQKTKRSKNEKWRPTETAFVQLDEKIQEVLKRGVQVEVLEDVAKKQDLTVEQTDKLNLIILEVFYGHDQILNLFQRIKTDLKLKPQTALNIAAEIGRRLFQPLQSILGNYEIAHRLWEKQASDLLGAAGDLESDRAPETEESTEPESQPAKESEETIRKRSLLASIESRLSNSPRPGSRQKFIFLRDLISDRPVLQDEETLRKLIDII